MYLVQVDDGLPEVVLLLVEVSHTNLTEVTGVVLFQCVSFLVPVSGLSSVARSRRGVLSNLVHVGTVVVLTTGKTTTTWVLAVLTDTTVTGRDVATAVREISLANNDSLQTRCSGDKSSAGRGQRQQPAASNRARHSSFRIQRLKGFRERTACGSSRIG